MKVQNCVDSGGKYCPCHLAYSNDCIRCNMLNSNNYCDCVWQGVCILSDINHDKYEKTKERNEYLCKVTSVKKIFDETFLLKIKIPKEITKDLIKPGAYVMLKSKEKNSDIFNTPISVMDINDDILEVVIKVLGVKTKNIVNTDEVVIKAPYFNGIFGLREINTTKNEKCVVMLSGLSQVNSIKVIKKLVESNNKVDVFVNYKGIVINEVIYKIKKFDVNIYYFDFENNLDKLIGHIKENNIKFVYSASSMIVSKILMDNIDEVDKSIKLSIANNNLICCGEGICGSCAIDINGETYKTCKSQIDSRVFLKAKF